MPPEPNSVLAFVDVHGQPELDVAGPSHFILTAVLVHRAQLEAVRTRLEQVRARYAPKGKQLPQDVAQFARALGELVEVPFQFYAVVVDKPRLPQSAGVSFPESLQRLLAGMLYRQLFSHYASLEVVIDEREREPFLGAFADYLLRHHASSLFDRPRVRFLSAAAEPLVRLAALVSGVLAYTYEQTRSAELLDLLRPAHALQIDEWPVRYRAASGTGSVAPGDPSDDDVARYSIAAAEGFIASKADSLDEDERGQVLVLARLLFEARFASPRAYLPTEILRQALAPVGKANESLHWLRSNVIAPLRDAGVLIASSARGYKIPLFVADVTDFVARTDTVVQPMLHRVARARDAVRKVTRGRVDVLADERFALLRAAVDAAERIT